MTSLKYSKNRGFFGSFAIALGSGLILLGAFGGCGGSDEPEVISKRSRIEIPADLVPGRPEPGVEAGAADKPAAVAKVEDSAPEQRPSPTAAPAPTPAQQKVVEAPAKATAAPAEPVKVAKRTTTTASKTVSKDLWAINVASFSTMKHASELKAGLEKAGFPSYVTKFTKDGKLWYRVRVGFFKSRDEAVEAGGKIRSRFNVGSAWVVRPSTEEIAEHSGSS